MTGLQKAFLLHIFVALLTFMVFIGIYLVTDNPYAANAGWALLCLAFLDKYVHGPIDERDELIVSRASNFGHSTFWITFVLGSIVATITVSSPINPTVLCFIPMAGFLVLALSRSGAGLFLSRA